MRRAVAPLALLLLSSAAGRAATVTFKTSDGWTIEGDYAAAKKGRPTVLLVHGVGAGRNEWAGFAAALRRRGMGTLGIDLRGHGRSTGGPQGRRTFEDFDASGEWPRAVEDVRAAVRWLAARRVEPARLALIGGSLGANLCAAVAGELPKVGALVLLSPGADYRGARLPPVDAAAALLAFSPPDGYAAETVLAEKRRRPALRVLEARGGHGAQMLSDPAFAAALTAFLEEKLP